MRKLIESGDQKQKKLAEKRNMRQAETEKVRWPTGATAAHCKTNTFRIKTLLSLCNCSCFPYKYKPAA